jgi:hypothetical protein
VSPEIVVTTVNKDPLECAREIVNYLEERGFLKPDGFSGNQI